MSDQSAQRRARPHAARARGLRADAGAIRRCPRVVYIWGVHSPQAMSGSLTRVLHGDLRPDPAHAAVVSAPERDPRRRAHRPLPHRVRDVVDGGQQPALPRPLPAARPRLELPRRDLLRTEWTTQHEKQLIANQTAKLASMLGAQGAVVTWDAGGNEFIEVVRTHPGVRAARHQDRVPHQRGRRDRRRAHHARAPARGRRHREHELLQERHAWPCPSPGPVRARDRRAHEDGAAGLDASGFMAAWTAPRCRRRGRSRRRGATTTTTASAR